MKTKEFYLRLKGAEHYIHGDNKERGYVYLHKYKNNDFEDKFDIGPLIHNPIFINESQNIFTEEEIKKIPNAVLEAFEKIEYLKEGE